jgi:hypothetical protein
MLGDGSIGQLCSWWIVGGRVYGLVGRWLPSVWVCGFGLKCVEREVLVVG